MQGSQNRSNQATVVMKSYNIHKRMVQNSRISPDANANNLSPKESLDVKDRARNISGSSSLVGLQSHSSYFKNSHEPNRAIVNPSIKVHGALKI